jgi:hypothetical protein
MLSQEQAQEILKALSSLPAEKIAEAQDFIFYLKERFGQHSAINESDGWSEEDIRDLANAALNYADQSL